MTRTHIRTDAETLEALAALIATPMPCAEHARMPAFSRRKAVSQGGNQ